MRLDVLIPTLNRAALLDRSLRSLMTAELPAGLDAHIWVIDNRCTDNTAAVVERYAAEHPGKVSRLFERRRGKSRALNTGIEASSGDLVGMIDDDEEVGKGWYRAIYDAFQDDSIEFVGGPYVAVWEAPPPEWVPYEYLAVLGAVDNGREVREYDASFEGILKGGNAVIRRRTLERVGPYAEWLGPAGSNRLLSCEDEEMYQRLLKTGARGRYLPALVIHHHVLAERLSPEYYRKWCFWRGVSRGLMDRTHPLPVPYLAGVPRFLFGRAARGFLKLLEHRAARQHWSQTFSDELSMWDLAGYFYGRHIYPLARFSPVRSRRRPR